VVSIQRWIQASSNWATDARHCRVEGVRLHPVVAQYAVHSRRDEAIAIGDKMSKVDIHRFWMIV
jgi:hypothetical protein